MNLVQARLTVKDGFQNEVTTAPQYNAGAIVEVADDATGYTTTFQYVKASAALTKNVPYTLVEGESAIGTATPATQAIGKIIGIPQVDIAKDSYGWVAIKGVCKAATGIQTKGSYLEVLNAGTTLVSDGSAETVGSVGISLEAATAAATVKVLLLGKRVQNAAS